MNASFLKALSVMGIGMLGIFIVTLIIIFFMVVLNKIPSDKQQ